ncbi:MAG: beta-ketoacyl-ACP synthase III [Actinomycetota bacterium]
MTAAVFSGLGIALPSGELTNDDLSRRVDRPAAWIEARTGIVSRRVAIEGESTSGLAIAASRGALADAGLTASDIDLIICATVTPDWAFPATACLIQAALGATVPAFDLNAGCSGFLFALAQADAAIRSGSARRVLVVGAEVLSRIVDHDDVGTSILFGDGAGAAVVEAGPDGAGFRTFRLFSDGSRPRLLFQARETGLIRMEGREVYREAVQSMSAAVAETLGGSGVSSDDVDLVVAHQANQRILDAVSERVGIDRARMFSNIRHRGNTSAASIPIALYEAREQGRLFDGALVLLAAFGAGFAWGAALLGWGTASPGSRRVPVLEAADA